MDRQEEGVSTCITPGALPCIHRKTSLSANRAVCQQCSPRRASSLCNPWLGWENSGVGSPGTGSCPLQSGRVDSGGHWVTAICFNQAHGWKKQSSRGAPWWGVTEDACAYGPTCVPSCVRVLEERSRTLVATEDNYRGLRPELSLRLQFHHAEF